MRCTTLLILMTLLPVAAQAQSVPSAFGIGQVELGGGAGLSIPIAQADADLGMAYHLRARVGLRTRWAAEVSTTMILLGEGETPSGGSIEAPDFWTTHFSAVFRTGGLGLATLLRGGIGWTRISLPDDVDVGNQFSWEFGLALEWRIGAVRTEIGPQFVAVNLGESTRKFVEIRASALIPIF